MANSWAINHIPAAYGVRECSIDTNTSVAGGITGSWSVSKPAVHPTELRL